MANRGAAFSGGSGAGYRGVIHITSAINANVVVGAAGFGYTVPYNQNPPTASGNGEATVMTANGQTLISAGGGAGASSWQTGGVAGAGGSITSFNLPEEFAYFNKSGNNGTGQGAGGGTATSGAASVYSGHTYGSSGSAGGGPGGGAASPSKHGYVLIKYLGQIAPTPPQLAYRCYANGGFYIYIKEDEISVGDNGYFVSPNYTQTFNISDLQKDTNLVIISVSDSTLTYSNYGYQASFPRYTDGDLYSEG